MTIDQVIELTRALGICELTSKPKQDIHYSLTIHEMQQFANLVAQHEREACAIVCDDINAKYKWPDDVAERVASQWCADSIRARGQA